MLTEMSTECDIPLLSHQSCTKDAQHGPNCKKRSHTLKRLVPLSETVAMEDENSKTTNSFKQRVKERAALGLVSKKSGVTMNLWWG